MQPHVSLAMEQKRAQFVDLLEQPVIQQVLRAQTYRKCGVVASNTIPALLGRPSWTEDLPPAPPPVLASLTCLCCKGCSPFCEHIKKQPDDPTG